MARFKTARPTRQPEDCSIDLAHQPKSLIERCFAADISSCAEGHRCGKGMAIGCCEPCDISPGSADVTRRERNELERELAQAFRRALEPTDATTREHLAQLIEDLEFKLLAPRVAA